MLYRFNVCGLSSREVFRFISILMIMVGLSFVSIKKIHPTADKKKTKTPSSINGKERWIEWM